LPGADGAGARRIARRFPSRDRHREQEGVEPRVVEALADVAAGGKPSPSVVLFRHATQRRPEQQSEILLANLGMIGSDLADGRIVVIEPGRIRVRRLPLIP
jgi:hypothetical protein